VKLNVGGWLVQGLCYASTVILLESLTFSAATKTNQVGTGERAKIAGVIVSRNGDLIRIHENNSSEQIIVAITENTKIERRKGKSPYYRHTGMDVTAMLPGLTIEAQSVGQRGRAARGR
jgi:hypothetical protein